MDHAPGSPSEYMTTIYNYFLYKNDIFGLFESKKVMKICSKTHQIAPLNFFRGSMPPNSLVASPLTLPNNSWPPLANPAYAHELLLRIFLRIHPGRQLIVCSALYVYALQNLFTGQKMSKIVAQHILKCFTWALFSNIMCP